MYHIVKEVHVQKKPLWLVDLLFQITPSLYREIGTKEDIEKRFDNILTLMLGAKVRWHHGKSLLSRIQHISHTNNSITVRGNRGIAILSFRIASEQPLSNQEAI